MDKKFFATLIVAVVAYLLLVLQPVQLYDVGQTPGHFEPKLGNILIFSLVIGLAAWGSITLVGKSRSIFDSIAEMTLFKDAPAAALLARR